jgi:hypothetical protein
MTEHTTRGIQGKRTRRRRHPQGPAIRVCRKVPRLRAGVVA